jgi:hypothetical protein
MSQLLVHIRLLMVGAFATAPVACGTPAGLSTNGLVMAQLPKSRSVIPIQLDSAVFRRFGST